MKTMKEETIDSLEFTISQTYSRSFILQRKKARPMPRCRCPASMKPLWIAWPAGYGILSGIP